MPLRQLMLHYLITACRYGSGSGIYKVIFFRAAFKAISAAIFTALRADNGSVSG